MPEELHNGTGLTTLPENPGARPDISFSKVVGAVAPDALPTVDFDVAKPLRIKNQGSLDFCSGFCGSEITEDQEGEEMDPLFQFAAAKRVMGEFKTWGADLRSAGMGLVKYGSLPQRLAPYFVGEETRDFLANWANYAAELWQKALEHKKLTMLFVDGPHDLFDNIRSVMWLNRSEKRSVMLGVNWRHSWTNAPGGIIPEWTPIKAGDSAGGHCIKGFGQKSIKNPDTKAVGWETINGQIYLKIQNSWGEGFGDKGIYYFPRSVVNAEFGPYGQITFRDMDPEDAHKANEEPKKKEDDAKVSDNWIVALAKALYDAFIKFFNR